MPHQVVIAVFLPEGIFGFHNHVCDGRLVEVERPTAGFVQQSIHGGKCLPGIERGGWKSSVGRQAVVETPSEEDGLAGLIEVWKSSPVEGHTGVSPQAMGNSH